MNSERAEFDRAIANLYGFKQLRLTPEYVVPARKHYPYLREQTAAFIAANSHRLSPLELQLLEANARLEGPLYSAFRDLLWALNALGLRGPPVRVPPPPYANEYDVVMSRHY